MPSNWNYLWKVQIQRLLPEIGKSRSIMDHCLADETSEGVQKTSRHVFIRSNMV